MIIEVGTQIEAPLSHVWNCWTKPEHIVNWNFASDDWCCPRAENKVKPDGHFNWRMEAKDGSMGFDFSGTYEDVVDQELITYKLDDGRKVEIHFRQEDNLVGVAESFEAEGTNSAEMQRAGWQAILDNFKSYVESKK